jgi:hypothetical protein
MTRIAHRTSFSPRTKSVIAGALAAALFAGPALGADWIEKVDIIANGIDTTPILVTANANGYKTTKTKNHKFLLRLYAKAKSGKRIVAGKVGTYGGVRYWEGGSSYWDKRLSRQAVSGGKKRTMRYSYTPVVPVSKIQWQGNSPLKACRQLLHIKTSSGQSKGAVLSKAWTTHAYAVVQFDAVATKKKNAKKMNWAIKNTTWERKTLSYRIPVHCLAGIKRATN